MHNLIDSLNFVLEALAKVIGAAQAMADNPEPAYNPAERQENAVLQLNEKNFGENLFTTKEIEKLPKKIKKLFTSGRFASVRRKPNGTYEIRCQINGYHISAASKNLEVAKSKFIRRLSEIDKAPEKKRIPFFKECAAEWLQIKVRTVKPSTYAEYERIVNKDLIPQFSNCLINDISRQKVQDYLFQFIDTGRLKTAGKIYLILKCIFDLACDDFNFVSPMKKIVLPYYEPKKGHCLTPEEEKTLTDYCIAGKDRRVTSALLVLLFFGLRKSELQTIKVFDDSIEVVTSKTLLGRNNVLRRIPFTSEVKKFLQNIDFNAAKTVNLNTLSNVFKKILPNHHPHELRYTFVTRCKECGVNPEIVMLWDGHEEDKSVKASKVDRGYTDFSWAFQLKEAEKVNYS